MVSQIENSNSLRLNLHADPNDAGKGDDKQKNDSKTGTSAVSQKKSQGETQSARPAVQSSPAKAAESSQGNGSSQQEETVQGKDSLSEPSLETAGRRQGEIGHLTSPLSQEGKMKDATDTGFRLPLVASAEPQEHPGSGDHAKSSDEHRHDHVPLPLAEKEQVYDEVLDLTPQKGILLPAMPKTLPDDPQLMRTTVQNPHQPDQVCDPHPHERLALMAHQQGPELKEGGDPSPRGEHVERGEHGVTERSGYDEDPSDARGGEQDPAGPRDMISTVQPRQEAGSGLPVHSQALAPQRDPPPPCEVQKCAAWQPVLGDIAIGGSNNPTFLSPVHNPTINFTQNVTLLHPISG